MSLEHVVLDVNKVVGPDVTRFASEDAFDIEALLNGWFTGQCGT